MFNRSTSVRLTNTLFVTQSLSSASQIAIFTLMTIMAFELSGNKSLSGLPSTTLTLVQALAAFPIGFLMGRFGRCFGLTLSYSISSIGALLGILAIMQGWFWMLLISAAFIGAGRAGSDQSRFAAGDMFPVQERGQMIGRIVFAGTVGAIFGPLLVTPSSNLSGIMQLLTQTGPWLMGTGFYLIAAIITFFVLRPDPMQIARDLAGEEQQLKNEDLGNGRSVKELLRVPQVQLAILSMLISQTVMVTLMVITPLHMYLHDHTTAAVSIVISAHTLGMFGLSIVTGRLVDRFGRVTMMLVAAITLIISAIISPLSTTLPVLVAGLFLLGLGWNFGYIAGSSMLADALIGEERSRLQGVNDMLVAGAAALGSLSSGPLFENGGYIMVAGVGAVLALLFIWLVRLLAADSSVKIKVA
jgi:MFS family permease